VIVLAGWFCYSPALHGGWLWDDAMEVARNPLLRSGSGLAKIWLGTASLDYLPVKGTIQWLEWHLWGDRVLLHHAVNVVLHLAGAFLIWSLLGRLGVRRAWLGGLLFAVHPLAVESVAWISELKNTLSLPFLLLAMIAYVDFDERGHAPKTSAGGNFRALAPSLLFFLLAMLSKSSAVMFPVIILLYGWWRRGRITLRDWTASAPFFAISALLGATAVWFQEHRVIDGQDLALGGPLSRLAAAGISLAFYLGHALLPSAPAPIYSRWPVGAPALWQLLPWIALGGACAWLWKRRDGWGRHALFGLGFFAINLLPVLGFLPMYYLRISSVADHLAYLPLAGIAGLAAAGLDAWLTRIQAAEFLGRGRFRDLAPSIAIVLLVAAMAVESRSYAGKFIDEETLWTYAVRQNPVSGVAHSNLAYTLLRSGRIGEALAEYEVSVSLAPEDATLHYNYGNALLRSGRPDGAAAQYETALEIRPRYAEAHNNLGVALQAGGRMPEAIAHLEAALRLQPSNADAHYNLGNALLRTRRPEEAVPQYEAAIRTFPENAEAHYNLGLALLQSGRFRDAVEEYERTVRLAPNNAEARNNLGNALARCGRTTDAMIEYETALRLDPNLTGARQGLQALLGN